MTFVSAVRRLATLCAPLLGLLLLIAALPARADTPISLFQSFRGNVNFVGTEETLRTKSNYYPCSLVSSGTGIYAYLGGIPSGATIKSAQLYWAGSGTAADYTVTFDGVTLTAPTTRQYVAKAYANNTSYAYFSGAADVTTQVSKKGNGYYTFSGLTVNAGNPWCAVQGVVGGFALVVVYSHPNEPFRMLNLYEGFQDFQNTSLSINLGNFNVPNPLPTSVTGRIGHITWEGDSTLSQGGEDLLFNGYEITDSINPKGNQFNSASNVTGDTTSYGIDFDIYSLKAPVIQPGQSSATTTYKSGQDLVILSAEIVAMPYVANADLSLAMTRTGDLTVGSSTNYTLTVANGGVDDEMGPVTVVDTLPAGLKLVSAGGTGWSCANAASNGQTIVTCTQAGPVKSGAKMTPLVISVTPSAVGNYTNTATVTGKTGDNNSANNTASNASTSVDYGSAAIVFTKEACKNGDKIVISPLDAGCHRFIGPVLAAATGSIYITAVSGAQVATSISPSDYPLSIDLKFSCLPNSSVPISYAGLQNFDCKGTWQTVNVKLPGGKPTAVLANADLLAPFVYRDVGRVSLTMRFMGSVMGTVDFISKPQDIRFRDILRSVDGYPDQQGTASTAAGVPGWPKPDIGFAKAGESFMLRLGAVMADGKWAPSFGQEAAALKGILADDNLDFAFELDLFAANLKGTPRLAIGAKDSVVREAFLLDQAFTRSKAPGFTNMFEAQARWFEAGMLGVTPSLVDYLNAGQVPEPPAEPGTASRLVDGTRIVGRFYPDHFETEATANFDCLAAMNCPAAAGVAVSGATYSLQPFTFNVAAYGLPRTPGGAATALSLYQNMIIDPSKPRPLTVRASKAPNLSLVPAVGAFAADPSAQLQTPAAPDDYPALGGTARYRLGDPYDPAKRTGGAWGAPTAVYLRASMDEFRGSLTGSPAYTNDTITSLTPLNAAAGTQYEDGLVVVSGRLFVPNLFGSELLRLPVPLTAQYWSGSGWLANGNDNDSVVASDLTAVSCTRSFALDVSPGPCRSGLLSLDGGSTAVRLGGGKGSRVLLSPGRGKAGSIDFTVKGGDAAPWLPSTQARATFGLFRSPVIYMREVY